MRKLPVLCFYLSLGLPATSYAQQPAAAPSDPKALILAAARLNNLVSNDTKPWHIKASFQLFDEQGAITDEGIYEEYWISPVKFKRIFTSKTFSETIFGSERGDLRAGAQGNVSNLLPLARRELLTPFPAAKSLEKASLSDKPLDAKGIKLDCITITTANGPTYCVTVSEPILRISGYHSGPDSFEIIRNRILSFQGHNIPGELKISRNGKLALAVHIDSLDAPGPVQDSLLTAPPDAVLIPRHFTVSGKTSEGMIIKKVPPEYPVAARATHLRGTVVLQALIDTDGTVKDLKPLSGPTPLRQAALEAVRQWRYKPFLLHGAPVQVETTIRVVFLMND